LNTPGYTVSDLLQAADAAGVHRSAPWIRTLISDGLLDQPQNHGIPGRRGGRQRATWPAEQFDLFSAELELIRSGVARTELCDIPVSLWLARGPGHVPVRQVRRALHASRRKPSKHAARQTARQLAELFAGGQDLSGRDGEELVAAFVDVATTGILDRDLLLQVARRVIDPEDAGRVIGPLGPWISHEGLVVSIQAHLTALERLDEFEESHFEAARPVCGQVIAMYEDLHPEWAEDPEVGQVFQTVTPEYIRKGACRLVLAVLGTMELSRQGAIPGTLASFEVRAAPAALPDTGIPNNSPPRPRQRPGGTAHGKATSACSPSLSPPRRAASL
jgi:hypothetical protein